MITAQGSDHPHHGIVLQYLSRSRLVTVTGPISSPRHAEEMSPAWGPFSQEEQEAGPETGLETGQTTVRVQGPSSKSVSKSGTGLGWAQAALNIHHS